MLVFEKHVFLEFPRQESEEMYFLYIYIYIYMQLYKLCRRQEEVEIGGIGEWAPSAERDHFQISLLTLSKFNQFN